MVFGRESISSIFPELFTNAKKKKMQLCVVFIYLQDNTTIIDLSKIRYYGYHVLGANS